MGIRSILGKVVGSAGRALAGDIVGIIDKFIETDEERQAWRLLEKKLVQESDKFQRELNKLESKSDSIFKSGWRPFLGWVCGVTIACSWLLFPVLAAAWPAFIVPEINVAAAISLVTSLLGLAGLRTYERQKGLIK